MIVYDSQKQSEESFSSESDNEQKDITHVERQNKKSEKRLKNAIAYRYLQDKQQNKLRLIFEQWRDQCIISYRCNILKAVQVHERRLLAKGFDSFMEYSGQTMQFKQKIMMFYYRYLLSKYFWGWKLHGDDEMKGKIRQFEDKKIIQQESQNILKRVNTTLDELIGERIRGENKIGKRSSTPEKVVKKSHSRSYLKAIASFEQFQISQQKKRIELGFRAIKCFLNNLNAKQRAKSTIDPLKSYHPAQQRKTRQLQKAVQTNEKRQKVKEEASFQRSRNLLINSRRTDTINSMQSSKSRRKLRAITEKIELPSFSKKSKEDQENEKIEKEENRLLPLKKNILKITQNQSFNIERQSRRPNFKIYQERKDISREEHVRENQTIKQRQRQRQRQIQIQRQRTIEQQKNKQMEKKQKQRQAQLIKQVNQRKNNILSSITKGKLLQIALLDEIDHQMEKLFSKYKQNSVQYLKKLALL